MYCVCLAPHRRQVSVGVIVAEVDQNMPRTYGEVLACSFGAVFRFGSGNSVCLVDVGSGHGEFRVLSSSFEYATGT